MPNQKVILHPSCFPNIAILSALVGEGEVVWEVHDNYQKQTYRNRYHICTDQGLLKLTIPIRHIGGSNGRQKYKGVEIENSYPWQKQHWKTLQTAYRTSPFFEFYEDELAPIFEQPFKHLMDFNWRSIQFLCESLQIPIPILKTESFQLKIESGLDGRFLINAKKNLHHPQEPYNQVFSDRHGFIPNVSALDLLFNEGPNALSYLKGHNFLNNA